jgi:signal transduction histidine kinase
LKPSDINRPIKEAIKLSSTTFRKLGIKIVCCLDEDLPSVLIDEQRIEEVILNLITNSIDALKDIEMPKIISVSSLKNNNDILIKIADSGPSIPDSIKEKIFDPFFTTKHYGTGIGLSLCQRIIIDHNGTISAATKDTGGAEFTISLPINKTIVQ